MNKRVWELILQIDFLPAYSCSGGSYKAWKKSYPKMVSPVSSFFFITSAWCQLGWMSCLRLGLLTVTNGSSFMNSILSWTRGEKVCVRGRSQNLNNQRTLTCQWFIPTSQKTPKNYPKSKTSAFLLQGSQVLLHLRAVFSVLHISDKCGFGGGVIFYKQLLGSVQVKREILPQQGNYFYQWHQLLRFPHPSHLRDESNDKRAGEGKMEGWWVEH